MTLTYGEKYIRKINALVTLRGLMPKGSKVIAIYRGATGSGRYYYDYYVIKCDFSLKPDTHNPILVRITNSLAFATDSRYSDRHECISTMYWDAPIRLAVDRMYPQDSGRSPLDVRDYVSMERI